MSQATTVSFTKIKSSVPIDIALHHYGIVLKPQGKRLVGCCPIHRGSNRKAFTVSADRRLWNCYGDCSTYGSVIDLIMALENCSLTEAADILIKRYCLKH